MPIDYYSDKELETLEVGFNAGNPVMKTNHLSNWLKKMEKIDEENVRKGVKVEKNFTYRNYLKNEENATVSQTKIPFIKNGLMFVINPNGKMYVNFKHRGISNHTSLANGKPVLSAGMIFCNEKGEIIGLSSYSGHYRSGKEQMLLAMEYLQQNGVKIDAFVNIAVGGTDIIEPLVIKGADIEDWMQEERILLLDQLKGFSVGAYNLCVSENYNIRKIFQLLKKSEFIKTNYLD